MYKDNRTIKAGENEIYRYGRKAVERVLSYLEPSEEGFLSIPVDGGRYYTIGTSKGKYGEFCKINGTIFSVNKGGFAWAKVGTDKEKAFKKAIEGMIEEMHKINESRFSEYGNEEE